MPVVFKDGELVEMTDSEFGPPPSALPAPIPDHASKLGLKRALAEIGRWAEVRAALAADSDLQEDWDLAVEIRRADPVTQAMIALLGLSEEEVDAILVRAVAIVGM